VTTAARVFPSFSLFCPSSRELTRCSSVRNPPTSVSLCLPLIQTSLFRSRRGTSLLTLETSRPFFCGFPFEGLGFYGGVLFLCVWGCCCWVCLFLFLFCRPWFLDLIRTPSLFSLPSDGWFERPIFLGRMISFPRTLPAFIDFSGIRLRPLLSSGSTADTPTVDGIRVSRVSRVCIKSDVFFRPSQTILAEPVSRVI